MILKRVRGYLMYCLGALFVLTPPSTCANGSEQAGLSAAVMIDEDYFSCGGSAELAKRVEGDAFLCGARVAVHGPVKGDLAVAGGDITVADTVGRDLYATGGSVAIGSQVAGNARIAGGHVTISQRGGIVGKATIAAISLQLSGRVGRYLAVHAESVRIAGEVGGDLHIAARSVEIGPDAKISGKLTYHSPQLAKIDPTAVIAGGVTHVEMDWPSGKIASFGRLAAWIWLALLALSSLVVGVVAILAFPKFSARAAYTVGSDPWKSVGLGFSLLLCLPVAAILFMITVIGIPIGLAVLWFYPVLLLLGFITGALFLGDRAVAWLAQRRAAAVRPGWRCGGLWVSLLVLLLACTIPLVGCVVAFLVLLFGLGAFCICAYRGYLRQDPTPEPSPLGLDLV